MPSSETCQQEEEHKTWASKLNLVDLAGSERVSRSQPVGTSLKEALHINLSLHFLEQVILALQVGIMLEINIQGSRYPLSMLEI